MEEHVSGNRYLTWLLLACTSCGVGTGRLAERSRALGDATSGRYIYAAFDDGSVHVYDIGNGHQEVASSPPVPGVFDASGVCASAQTGMFYISHEVYPSNGGVIAVDMYTLTVVWNQVYYPDTDRLSCTPDGLKLYVPSGEPFDDDEMIVLDASNGNEITRIHVSPRPHDSLMNLAGTRVYLETKSSQYNYRIDTTTDTIIGQIGPFGGIGGPFTINGNETRLYGNFFGINGFQVGDITTGEVLDTVEIAGQQSVPGDLNQHGIGLRPDETEIWVNDGVGGQALVHVFDVTVRPPQPLRDVPISYSSPHWVTFTIRGDFAYVSGPESSGRPCDVIDTSTYQRVGSIGPSEDMLEVDFENGAIVRVGSQFGVGRVTP
jgi:hypothetical protein